MCRLCGIRLAPFCRRFAAASSRRWRSGRPNAYPLSLTCLDGYAYYDIEVDRWGNAVSTTYRVADGKPAVHREGHAKVVAVYDARGNKVEVRYLGTDGKPVPGKYGVASATLKFDDRVGACTGRSAGFSRLRMRSTYRLVGTTHCRSAGMAGSRIETACCMTFAFAPAMPCGSVPCSTLIGIPPCVQHGVASSGAPLPRRRSLACRHRHQHNRRVAERCER